MTPLRRRALTLIELLVVVALLALLIGLLLPAVQKVRGAVARVKCLNNVRQLSLAVRNYEAAHGRLPGTASADANDWALAVLPYIEQDKLALQFDPRYTAGEPPNAAPARLRPPVFRCPTRPDEPSFLPDVPASHYGMNTSLSGLSLNQIPEQGRTLLFGELADIPMPWVVSPPMVAPEAGFFHDNRTTVGFADGHAECLESRALKGLVFEIGKEPALVGGDGP